jgi:inner membrane transporter RhtA
MVEITATKPRTIASPLASSGRIPPWTLAFGAIVSVQIGSALSMDLIAAVGAAGTAWLRLSIGALVFLAVARPPLRSVRRRHVLPLLALGVTTGLMSTAFLAAIERIPLGTAVAIEFLGPLAVAAIRSHGPSSLKARNLCARIQ